MLLHIQRFIGQGGFFLFRGKDGGAGGGGTAAPKPVAPTGSKGSKN